jgi:hypothetical protein
LSRWDSGAHGSHYQIGIVRFTDDLDGSRITASDGIQFALCVVVTTTPRPASTALDRSTVKLAHRAAAQEGAQRIAGSRITRSSRRRLVSRGRQQSDGVGELTHDSGVRLHRSRDRRHGSLLSGDLALHLCHTAAIGRLRICGTPPAPRQLSTIS